MHYSVNQVKNDWIPSQGVALEDFLLLARYVVGKDATEFAREPDHSLTKEEYSELTALLERRAKHEPVAYLLGRKEFFGREFLVNKHTLIPRPDSECLIEDVLSYYQSDPLKPKYIFDIGTGSGALAITLHEELKNFSPGIRFIASDISSEALATAKDNADIYNTDITFLEGSLLEPCQEYLSSEKYVYIVANLPYVSHELLQRTAPDVQNYEPISALVSEDEGLAHYIQLLQEIQNQQPTLRGVCWLEISPEQTERLTAEIRRLFPRSELFIGKDLAQRQRFIRFTL